MPDAVTPDEVSLCVEFLEGDSVLLLVLEGLEHHLEAVEVLDEERLRALALLVLGPDGVEPFARALVRNRGEYLPDSVVLAAELLLRGHVFGRNDVPGDCLSEVVNNRELEALLEAAARVLLLLADQHAEQPDAPAVVRYALDLLDVRVERPALALRLLQVARVPRKTHDSLNLIEPARHHAQSERVERERERKTDSSPPCLFLTRAIRVLIY